MKFNHFTVNTKSNCVQDSEEIFIDDRIKHQVEKIVEEIALHLNKPVDVVEGYIAQGVVTKDSYSITLLSADGMPCLETSGFFTEDAKKTFPDLMDKLKPLGLPNVNGEVEKLKAPIVTDIIFPVLSNKDREFLTWSGDFCRCIAAVVFEKMSANLK